MHFDHAKILLECNDAQEKAVHSNTVRAVSIRDEDERGVLAVHLVDLLELAGPAAITSLWRCSHVEALGAAASRIHAVDDERRVVSGAELLEIARDLAQIIDGELAASHKLGAPAWLTVRMIDSSECVVITASEEILRRIQGAYRDVRDSPDDIV